MKYTVALIAAALVAAGCQSNRPVAPVAVQPLPASTPVVLPAPAAPVPVQLARAAKYSVAGADSNYASHPILGHATVATAIHEAFPDGVPANTTVVLIRRTPEGTCQEPIDLDCQSTLRNPRQNYALRDGDQIALPAAVALPDGLQRPPMMSNRAAP